MIIKCRFWGVIWSRFKDFALVNWILDKSWHVVKISDQKFSTFVSKITILVILRKLTIWVVILSCWWGGWNTQNRWFRCFEKGGDLKTLDSCIIQYINWSVCVRSVEIDEIVNFAQNRRFWRFLSKLTTSSILRYSDCSCFPYINWSIWIESVNFDKIVILTKLTSRFREIATLSM